MSKRILTLGLPSVSLMCLLACGGGGSSSDTSTPIATSIVYTDPTGVPATSYSLKKNTALSTPGTHLVLDLYGPATSITGSGVVLALNLDLAKATWSSTPVTNGTVFVTNANGDPIVKGKLTGSTLQVVATERGVATAKAFSGPLLRVALDLKSGLTSGTAITMTLDSTKSQALLGTPGAIAALPDVRIGSLKAQ